MAYSFGPGPITPAVRILLYANIAMYLVSLFFPVVLEWFGLQPQLVIEKYRLWQPVTYMFLHAPSPSHILFNMLILWMFGVELERLWRTPFFVKYYFVTGVGAGLLSIVAAFLPSEATRATYVSELPGRQPFSRCTSCTSSASARSFSNRSRRLRARKGAPSG